MRVQKNITSTGCAQDIEGLSEGRKFRDSFSEPASHFQPVLARFSAEILITCYGTRKFSIANIFGPDGRRVFK